MAQAKKPTKSKEVKYSLFVFSTLGFLLFIYLAFSAYAYLGYGGVKGFQYAHQTFPGVHSTEVEKGRKSATEALAKVNAAVTGLDIKSTYASPFIKNVDICVKGIHQSGPFAGHDNYAYSCTLNTTQYYAYTQGRCDIVTSLQTQAKEVLSGGPCDTTVTNTNFYSGDGNFYSKGVFQGGTEVSVLVFDKSALLKQNPLITTSGEDCSGFRQTIYCSDLSVPTSNEAIPPKAQTIIVVSLDESIYYQK